MPGDNPNDTSTSEVVGIGAVTGNVDDVAKVCVNTATGDNIIDSTV